MKTVNNDLDVLHEKYAKRFDSHTAVIYRLWCTSTIHKVKINIK